MAKFIEDSAVTVKNKVNTVEKTKEITSLLYSNLPQIRKALPKHMDTDRFVRIALSNIRKTPELLECNKLSVCSAVMASAEIGLEPGDALGRAYLIPYGKECQFQIGYKGLIELAKRSGKVRWVKATEVKAGEVFEFEEGTNPYIKHIPAEDCADNPPIAYYAVIAYLDGEKNFKVLWKKDVDKIRGKSPSRNSPAWKEWYEEQGKKCAIKRLLKTEQLSPELSKAVTLDDLAEAGIHQNLTPPQTIDAEVVADEPEEDACGEPQQNENDDLDAKAEEAKKELFE